MGCSFCRPSFCVNNPSIYSRIAITQVGTSKQTTQSHKNQQAYQCNNRQIGQNHKRQSNPQTPSPSQYARIVLPTDLFHFAAPSLNLIGQLVLREPIAVTVERARLIRQVEESPPYPMVAMPDTVEYYAARFARNGDPIRNAGLRTVSNKPIFYSYRKVNGSSPILTSNSFSSGMRISVPSASTSCLVR